MYFCHIIHIKTTIKSAPDKNCPAHHLKTYVTYENDCKSYFAGGATYQLTPCMLAPPDQSIPPRNRSLLSGI